MSAVSSSFEAHHGVHSMKSAISLYLKKCHTNQGSHRNRLGQELGPTHPSLRSAAAIMITGKARDFESNLLMASRDVSRLVDASLLETSEARAWVY
jgi:hypothetical protein